MVRIGLDIDGVIRPWHKSMYRYFQTFKGYEEDEVKFWDYFRSLPKDTQDYYVSIPLMYLDTVPTKDARTYVPKLAELGEIYYITSCGEGLKWTTGKFFDLYELPFKENVIFSKDKATYVRELGIDYFLDDLAHNLAPMRGLTKVFLFKCIHNIPHREFFPVINSIQEFYEMIRRENDSKVD